jgi:peroxiredoxin
MHRFALALLILAAVSVTFAQKGSPALDFSATTLDGRSVQLSDLKGKVVLLTFWSTRCVICHSEIPKLNKIAAAHVGKDVVFIGATAEDRDKVSAYTKKNPFSFELLPDSFGLMLNYSPKDGNGYVRIAYPAYYLIDKAGNIEYHSNGWSKTGQIENNIMRMLGR